MFRLLFLEECTSSLLANRLDRLCFAYICGIAISKSNDVTTLSWDAVGWDGMGQSKLPWDGMGMGRETVSHGQPSEEQLLHGRANHEAMTLALPSGTQKIYTSIANSYR